MPRQTSNCRFMYTIGISKTTYVPQSNGIDCLTGHKQSEKGKGSKPVAVGSGQTGSEGLWWWSSGEKQHQYVGSCCSEYCTDSQCVAVHMCMQLIQECVWGSRWWKRTPDGIKVGFACHLFDIVTWPGVSAWSSYLSLTEWWRQKHYSWYKCCHAHCNHAMVNNAPLYVAELRVQTLPARTHGDVTGIAVNGSSIVLPSEIISSETG